MKKRILSALLVCTMLLASSVCTFAALNEDTVLGKVGEVLDEVNYDAANGEWQKDIDYHAAQIDAISDASDNVDSADISDIVEAILEHDGLTTNQKLYLCALAKADSNPDVAAVLNSYNTAGLSWKQSFDPLQDFADYLGDSTDVIAPPGQPEDVAAEYDNVLANNELRGLLASKIEATIKNLLKVAFSTTGAELETNYNNGIELDDITKKTLMVFASEVVEKEGIPFRTAADVSELATAAKDYALSFKTDANIAMAKDTLDYVASADYEDTISLVFDAAAAAVPTVNKGSETNYFVGKDILVDLQLIFGTASEEGIVEEILNEVDPDFEATNMLLNVALSEGLQLNTPGGRISDLRESATPAVTLRHESSLDVKTEAVSALGRALEPIALNTGWFDIALYDENGDELEGVTYDDGQIFVVKDIPRGVESAYMVLYRKDAAGEEKTFIETYPVNIDFTQGTTPAPSRPSGGSVTRYSITFDTNGGNEISSVSYPRGTVVQLVMVPTKDGYIFDGWYEDAELTRKIETITVDTNKTIYAGWKKDGGSVVSKVEIPAILESEDHYAYVMGYPEGDIRPNGNITRAEAVTMIFRLLDEEVRTANLTTENVFEDVTADNWFNTAVSTLAKLEIVEGRTETTFDPNANITRAEFATMFARLAEYEYVAEADYPDVAGHWATAFIEEVDAYGWIAGYEDGTFRPDRKITRAEAMTLINRVLKRNPETKADLLDDMTIWTDNADETAWYYLAVQEATNSHDYERKSNDFETWIKMLENKDWTKFEN